MRFLPVGIIVIVSACGGGGGGSLGGDGISRDGPITTTPDTPPDTPGEEHPYGNVDVSEFSMYLNEERADAEVTPVSPDERLIRASKDHASDMLAHDYLSHTGRNGSTPGDRAIAAGYNWDFIAENIARGQESEEEVVDAWMNSPDHRANMLDPRPEDFGIGRSGDIWVLMLGSER